MAGSLLRELRGNDSGDTSSARSSARTTRARRSRAKTQTKRAATNSSAKGRSKRTGARARAKGQPSGAQSKRTAARARAQARPTPTAGPQPLDDRMIAREVESTIFRDVEVDRGQVDLTVAEGVVRLRGEVRTPDLINELEARAAGVPHVRRVENLLRATAPRPDTAAPAAQQLGTSGGPPAPASVLRTTGLAAAARAAGAAPSESAGPAPEPAAGRPEGQTEPAAAAPESPSEPPARALDDHAEPAAGGPEGPPQPAARAPEGDAESAAGGPEGSPEPAAGGQEGDESADSNEPDVAELDRDPAYQPKDPGLHGLKGG
jgi:osmotically-inducible protein OsmY